MVLVYDFINVDSYIDQQTDQINNFESLYVSCDSIGVWVMDGFAIAKEKKSGGLNLNVTEKFYE